MKLNLEKTRVKNLEIHITTHCTLNCRLCANGIKYVKSQEHFPFEKLCNEIDLMFQLVDYTDKLEIMGGEPLLHPDLPEIIEKVLEYSPQIGILRLPTNGTIIPSPNVIDTFLKNKKNVCKMEFLISHYGNLSYKAEQIIKLCKENEIYCRVDIYHGNDMYYGGWIDFGTDCNRLPKTTEETLLLFSNCACAKHGYAMFVKGKLYPCSASVLRLRSGLDKNIPGLIDLFDDAPMESKRKQLMKYADNPYYVCQYCDGMNENSKRYPGGEQK